MVDQYGNMLVVLILLVFDVVVCDGCIQWGQYVLIEGVGGGFIWGVLVFCF